MRFFILDLTVAEPFDGDGLDEEVGSANEFLLGLLTCLLLYPRIR